ncbi:MAG: class I SAM-dependent methyltransferase [Actinomycetota bacterium]|nr:class I SAM-dependent methyltransferase [Actinomycetota bacterium]
MSGRGELLEGGPVNGRHREVERTMRDYWDAKARENAMFYIHSELDYAHSDPEAFWRSGEENLERTLGLFDDHVLPGDDVVEIGCGMGRMTRPLALRAGKVIGVDVSEEMVRRAREALADLTNVTLFVGSGIDLAGIPDASADVVYSFIVFQHIPDPAITCRYVRDIGRVLRPGGWTLFQVSDFPAIHRAESHPGQHAWRNRLAQIRGRRPRGCLSSPWLGSAVARRDLLRALAAGGLVLDGTVGDATQYCFVRAHRPGGNRSTS